MIMRKYIGECGITLDEAKRFMGFLGRNDRDEEIRSVLNAAVALVEERQNVSLRPMTIVLPVTGSSARYPLYLHPVSEVISVKDAQSGDDLDYQLAYAKDSIAVRASRPFVVEYKTEAVTDNMLEIYKPAVLTMAALMFDGSTDTEAYRKVFNSFMIPSVL